ncbi:HD domain-containing protein [Picrophilus oshimae]|uniref:HD domain-containing protein n=1 Tax=Picrophilus torridus (strain ATCC 700027 / DSM 9790 / JCM 10055 / NBRC 100828 / KAW 2/3) TaxID=1122961 RepID=A0A8G2FWP9_PICTO|nr:HD domain-containing protein [Picrophilus oshimae]SMD30856.1 hypothetical protein SAMN02745355_0770 [Picrophilus oshimae DSM 9789]
MDYKIIEDPLNGMIKISGVYLELLDSDYFQRLRYIKQLGMCNLVFPGANHTRFEHSIGTMFIARKFMDHLNIDAEEIGIAAMLHDIGHPPFSHSLEDLFNELYGMRHEDMTFKIINGIYPYNDSKIPEIIEKYHYDLKMVSDLATGKKSSYSWIISGPVDSDELDYIRRDAFYTGTGINIDYERIINTSSMDNNDLIIEEKGIPAIEAAMIARLIMYKSVYFHKTCRIAQKMLEIAYKNYSYDVKDLKKTDFELMYDMLKYDKSCNIIRNIMNRRLYKVYKRIKYDENEYKKLSKNIIDVIPPLSFFGSDRIKNNIYVYVNNRKENLKDISPIIRALDDYISNKYIFLMK